MHPDTQSLIDQIAHVVDEAFTTAREAERRAAQWEQTAGRQRGEKSKDDYQIGHLTGERDELARQLSELRAILTEIVGKEALCNCGPYFSQGEGFERRIRAALDTPRVSSNRAEVEQSFVEETQELSELRAMTRTAGLIADERAHVATSLLVLQRCAVALCRALEQDDNNVTPDTAVLLSALRAAVGEGET